MPKGSSKRAKRKDFVWVTERSFPFVLDDKFIHSIFFIVLWVNTIQTHIFFPIFFVIFFPAEFLTKTKCTYWSRLCFQSCGYREPRNNKNPSINAVDKNKSSGFCALVEHPKLEDTFTRNTVLKNDFRLRTAKFL